MNLKTHLSPAPLLRIGRRGGRILGRRFPRALPWAIALSPPVGLRLAVSPVLVTRRRAGIWYGDGVVDALVLRCIRVKRPDLLSGPSFFNEPV